MTAAIDEEGSARNGQSWGPGEKARVRPTLIVGYGNPLRSDDGVGVRAAEELARVNTDPAIEVLAPRQLTPELAERLSRVDLAIFVDAVAGGEPGHVEVMQLAPAASAEQDFTHHLAPSALLALAAVLYGRAPLAYAITVSARNFETGTELAPQVEAAVLRVIELVRELLARPE